MTKIMLVEDDKSLREIYGIRLIAEGYEIKSANDGEQALAMAIKEKPDLIISDVMMPKISGFDMLDILRATPETKDIKVIMMTALSSEDQRTRGESLGANRYLVKSQVGIEDVVRTVHDVLADAPVAAPAAPSFGPLAPSSSTTSAVPTLAPTMQPVVNTQTNTMPDPKPEVMSPSAPDSIMPQPTAPFSSPAPASLADSMNKPAEVESAPMTPDVAPQPMSVPVDDAPTPVLPPMPDLAPTMQPTPIEVPAPMPPAAPAPQPTSIPVQHIEQAPAAPMESIETPSATPITPAAPQQGQVQPLTADASVPDISDLIAKELGGSQQIPPLPPQQG